MSRGCRRRRSADHGWSSKRGQILRESAALMRHSCGLQGNCLVTFANVLSLSRSLSSLYTSITMLTTWSVDSLFSFLAYSSPSLYLSYQLLYQISFSLSLSNFEPWTHSPWAYELLVCCDMPWTGWDILLTNKPNRRCGLSLVRDK